MIDISDAREIMRLDLERRDIHRLLMKEQVARKKFDARLAAKDQKIAKMQYVIERNKRYHEGQMEDIRNRMVDLGGKYGATKAKSDRHGRILGKMKGKRQSRREHIRRLLAKIEDLKKYYETRMDQAQCMMVVVREATDYINWQCHDGTNPIDCTKQPNCCEAEDGKCELHALWKAVDRYTKVTAAREKEEARA